MSDEKIREAFEQFIIWRDGSIWVTVLGDKRSYNEPIERDFSIWCKSREAIEVELPRALDSDRGWIIDRDETRENIEAAGIKVKP